VTISDVSPLDEHISDKNQGVKWLCPVPAARLEWATLSQFKPYVAPYP